MAITLNQQPQFFQPACNPFIWSWSSDQTTQANFSFIVELYVDFVLVSTHQVFNESQNFAKFDASGDLRCLLTSDMVTTGSLLTYYDPAIAFVYIKIYEKYGTPPTLQSSLNTASLTKRAWNASLRHPDFIAFDHYDYMLSRINPNSGNIKFLTDFPRARKYFVGLYESAFLTFLNRGGSPTTDFELKLYDATNTLIASDNLSIPLALNIGVLDCAPQNLIGNTTVTLANFQACAYYTIRIKATDFPAFFSGYSETFTFYMDTECHRYDTRRLHWLNKLGGWDSFTFTLVSLNTSKVTTSDYQRERGDWNTAGTDWEYTLYHGQDMAFNKYATDQLVLNSDWIHESVQNWLVRDLYESPKVYLETLPQRFEPVRITNEAYALKQRRVDGLMRETVNIERTYNYNSQLV